MSGTTSAEAFASLDDLPVDALPLLGSTLFACAPWWRCVQAHAMAPHEAACFVLARIDRRPAALMAFRRSAGSALSSLTTPYTCLYAPALDPALPPTTHLTALAAIARFCRRSAVTRLEALDEDASSTTLLAAAARRAGLVVLPYAHFGNWHDDVTDLDWPAWLARRPGALRETIRRRLRRAERIAGAALTVVDRPDGLEAGIAAYESVYARSWKDPEPFPRFNAALMRALAPAGMLRLGIWSVEGQPVAAQLWVVDHGRATVLKLAHDEAFKLLSPGTVLTAMMVRRLLEQDHVTALDFGRGDDGYKQDWVGQRRQRIGLLLVNPSRPAGWPALSRHLAGRLLRRNRPDTAVTPASPGGGG